MSQSTDLLARGITLSDAEHGQSFTIDGVAGTKTGIIEDAPEMMELGMSGMETKKTIVITIPRATWTPTLKSVVTVGGDAHTVTKIFSHTPTQWRFEAELR